MEDIEELVAASGVTFTQLEGMTLDGLGLCLSCGEEHPIEPDASHCKCPGCGDKMLFGAAEILISIDPSVLED